MHTLRLEGRVHDAEDTTAVPAEVPGTDGGACTCWEDTTRAGAGVRAVVRNDPQSGPTGRARERRSASGLTTEEREDLRRLRRENRQLRLEWKILEGAAAWFALTSIDPSHIELVGLVDRAAHLLRLAGVDEPQNHPRRLDLIGNQVPVPIVSTATVDPGLQPAKNSISGPLLCATRSLRTTFPLSSSTNAHVYCLCASNALHYILRLLAAIATSLHRQRTPLPERRRAFITSGYEKTHAAQTEAKRKEEPIRTDGSYEALGRHIKPAPT